jgi:hypothetical protein
VESEVSYLIKAQGCDPSGDRYPTKAAAIKQIRVWVKADLRAARRAWGKVIVRVIDQRVWEVIEDAGQYSQLWSRYTVHEA